MKHIDFNSILLVFDMFFFTINHHHNLTTTTTTIIENIVIIISLHCTVPECFAEPSSSLVVQPKLQHSMLQTYSLHPSLMRHHTARCKDKIIPNSLHKKQAKKQVNNCVNAVQRIFSAIGHPQCSQSSQLHWESKFASWPNDDQRITQCSPEILARQVKDHSWPVRQKYAPQVHFSGGGGGGWREGHGPARFEKFWS